MKTHLLPIRLMLVFGALAGSHHTVAEEPAMPLDAAQAVPPVKDQWKLLASLTATRWKLEDLCGSPLVEGSQVILEFPTINKVAGRSSVNHFSGAINIEKERLKLGPLVVTEMAGPPGFMTQEQAFLDALAKASSLSLKEEVLFIQVQGKDKPLRFTRVAKE